MFWILIPIEEETFCDLTRAGVLTEEGKEGETVTFTIEGVTQEIVGIVYDSNNPDHRSVTDHLPVEPLFVVDSDDDDDDDSDDDDSDDEDYSKYPLKF